MPNYARLMQSYKDCIKKVQKSAGKVTGNYWVYTMKEPEKLMGNYFKKCKERTRKLLEIYLAKIMKLLGKYQEIPGNYLKTRRGRPS